MSVITSPTPSIVELHEEKNRRIYKWISQTPSPSSGGFADAFSPPSITPTIASLPEEFFPEEQKELDREKLSFSPHSRSNSVSSDDTFVVLDRSLPRLPAHPQQHPHHPSLVPRSIPVPIQPIPLSPVQIQPQLASLGPLKQRRLTKPLQLPIPMATHAYPSHQPIVIESPRRHRGHRHHHQHGHDHRDHEYDRNRGHRHRRRSPSPVRSPVHSSSGTRSRSQPARARHIDETMQLSRDLGADDDKSLVMPPDYHPVSGSGGGSGSRTNETSKLSRMMGRMNLSRSRPEGYGGPAEGQPGPINPNAGGGGSHSQLAPQSPSQYQQHSPTQTQGHHSHQGHGQAPKNRHQNMEQLAGVVASQYVQQHMPSTHHQPHSQHQPSSHHGHHSHHTPGSGSRSRHRSASQSYAQPATYMIQPSHSQAPPTATRPTYTRRRSKSVDERELGTYRSRYPGSPRPSGYHNSPSPQQQQQVYSHSPPQGYAGSAMGAPSRPIATLPGGGAVVQQTNQPMLVPIDQGRGGWAVVPPAGQEIRVIGSANAHNVVPAVESRTVLRHASKSRHHRSRSAQPAAEGQGHGGFLKKFFGMGKKSSTSSGGGAGGNHNYYAGRGVVQHVKPVQYVDPGRHGGRHGEREREKERNGERAHRRRRRESY
ncbi:hypothetical protein CPC08DRAFT_823185 [Agrocybe pediades]|nr:hypothetical protein CPC08DRAFT_823185 [Agrocybe pediades]